MRQGKKTSSLQKLWRAWETGDYMASEINVQNSGCERLGTGLSSNRVRRLLCLCQAWHQLQNPSGHANQTGHWQSLLNRPNPLQVVTLVAVTSIIAILKALTEFLLDLTWSNPLGIHNSLLLSPSFKFLPFLFQALLKFDFKSSALLL